MTEDPEKSPKSYGVAVVLCGIFGVMGIHHFYLEDYLHGIADLALFVLAIWLFAQGNVGMATLVILVDALHSVIIFYYLIIEKWRDGQGRPVTL
ncbi:MAG: TM2 domain-containing membrane protein YozV [Paracoccaceae bacterium]|jgi:TM2 domain-containing membrane protein YozV